MGRSPSQNESARAALAPANPTRSSPFPDQRSKTMALSDPVLSGPGAGRTVTHGGGTSSELKLAGEQSGGCCGVVEWRFRAGDEPPVHTHTREDEALYFLEGAITAYVGDEKIEVEAGSYAALPK